MAETGPTAMADPAREIERLIAQESRLVLPRFCADEAWWLGCFLRDAARARQAPVAIVLSSGPTRLFSALLAGATDDNLGWIERKTALAWRFQQSSYVTGLKLKAGDNLFERFGLDHRTYAAAGGAVPIRVAGAGMIGVAAVSGLPQLEDHELVVEALGALQARLAGPDDATTDTARGER